MRRTWKDACCDVALNKVAKEYRENYPFFYLNHFMQGIFDFLWGMCGAGPGNPIHIDSYATKDELRAAFMKWLDENEVK